MKISAISSNYSTVNRNRANCSTPVPAFQAVPKKLPKKFVFPKMDAPFILSNGKADLTKVKELKAPNFRVVAPTCASGGTFSDRPLKDLKELKASGIKTIIDFRGEASNYFEQKCKKAGLAYYNFNLNNVINFSNPEYFIHKENKRTEISDKFIEKLKLFFRIVNRGNVYMGCQYGIDRTNMALTLNYLLNPECENAPELLTWPYERKKTIANKNIKVIKKIIKRLSEEQKIELGITGNFENVFKNRIYELLVKNKLI